jgi:aminoglycoside phosphotransferase (APT) family kinase protein
VLAYALHGRQRATGQPVLRQAVGKVFRDERGQRLLALQERLYRCGFGHDAADGIDVPQPLAYIPEMRMLLQARVPGETLDALTLRGGAGPQAARAAQALAKLHSSRAFALPSSNGCSAPQESLQLEPYTLADELRGLDDYTARLAQERPDAQPAVQALRAALLNWAGRLPAPPVVTPLHRDFYYSQLLFDRSHLHLIDFDLLAQGDPAVDVANFSAHLAYLGLEQGGDVRRLAGDAQRFLAAYGAAMTPDASFSERVAFYQAATWFRLLNVVASRPAVRHLFDPLLAHCRAALRHDVPAEAQGTP